MTGQRPLPALRFRFHTAALIRHEPIAGRHPHFRQRRGIHHRVGGNHLVPAPADAPRARRPRHPSAIPARRAASRGGCNRRPSSRTASSCRSSAAASDRGANGNRVGGQPADEHVVGPFAAGLAVTRRRNARRKSARLRAAVPLPGGSPAPSGPISMSDAAISAGVAGRPMPSVAVAAPRASLAAASTRPCSPPTAVSDQMTRLRAISARRRPRARHPHASSL